MNVTQYTEGRLSGLIPEDYLPPVLFGISPHHPREYLAYTPPVPVSVEALCCQFAEPSFYP